MTDIQYELFTTILGYIGALFGLYIGFNMVFKKKVNMVE